MKKNDMQESIKEPGFWARLTAVLLPLPPPLITGICIGFEDDDKCERQRKYGEVKMLKGTIAEGLRRLDFLLTGKRLVEFDHEILKKDMGDLAGVESVDGIHAWRREDGEISLAAKIFIADFSHRNEIQTSLKTMLNNRYGIAHSILEFESR